MENETVQVLVLDCQGCWSGGLSLDSATTLIAVASEDPADWSEMVALWPRYTTRAVPEYASSLPMENVDRAQALQAIDESGSWVVLDLVQKRFLSGKSFQPVGYDACFAMDTEENGDQIDPLSIHLPPWWELHEQVAAVVVGQPRQLPLKVPMVDREVLFGAPLIGDLAKRILQMANSDRLQEAVEESKNGNNRRFHDMTIEVHRDWLMTPRDDLNGMFPRQLLHGGTDWHRKIVWGHRLRFEKGRQPIVAAPTTVQGYRNGAMGIEEMAVYFNLCRELIGAGWDWCEENVPSPDEKRLIAFLMEVKTEWLASPFEGGSTPAFILECSRRRVPRGAGVEIIGMDERESEQHMIDCDCPICQMMADGMFGIGFTSIDGHHLDLDNEFAFSTHETREAWEAEQREWAEMSAKWEREREEREQKNAARQPEQDEFGSVWSGTVSDDPLPGDPSGNLKLAFLLAEIVGELQRAKAPHELIRSLNADFSRFRKAEPEELELFASDLIVSLECVTDDYPEFVPRIADFQSRIAERIRQSVSYPEDGDDDVPW